jgi:hypothetical protein
MTTALQVFICPVPAGVLILGVRRAGNLLRSFAFDAGGLAPRI